MDFPVFKIEQGGKNDRKNGPPKKTRIFQTRLLGYLTADALWDSSRSDVLRPVWLAYLGTERETHPFTANLRAGAKAAAGAATVQFPKRAPLRWTAQKVPGGIVTVAYLPELFHLEPALPFAEKVRFVLAPPRWWVEEQAARLAPEFGEDASDVARAALFCAFLDRRTPLPLVHDLRFHLQLYRAALATDWIHPFTGAPRRHVILHARGTEACGLDAPIACRVDQETLSAFLVEQTALYHQAEIHRGPTRTAPDRRLLPVPAAPAAQLRLDLEVA
jgi:hypothetical protein